MQVVSPTYRCAWLSRTVQLFERFVVDVELHRVGLGAPRPLRHRQVHQVGGLAAAAARRARRRAGPAAGPHPAAGLDKLVVVEFVAASSGVALVLGHGVWDALVHIDVDLGPEDRHVVT